MSSEQFKDLVFLTATDTTIGFVSKNAQKLNQIKQRPQNKLFITVLPSLDKLNSLTRIPPAHSLRVRRSQKTTFIMPNGDSYRVVHDRRHNLLLNRLGWAYSTSANPSGKEYDEEFAHKSADIIIAPLKQNGQASSLFKLGKRKIQRLR
ncbi:MAG: Sua5 YciO YrdC YwlC family protein [Campylobacterales bacterium]|nr:Sua5 YciO YrdC YwlC family protein [Campylobacterales bacterium]